MLQISQSYKDGQVSLIEVPDPTPRAGTVIVRNVVSLISAGTERYMIDMGRKSLVGKGLARPDLLRRVYHKARKEGLWQTWKLVQNQLSVPMPLGYSAAGIVEAVGEGVHHVAVGDRVACVGFPYAIHAERLAMPPILVRKLPDNVDFDSGSYGMLGLIAMHGVRCAKPELGYKVGVIGLGLLGLITVQLLKAAGCRVFGVDVSAGKIEKARGLGLDAGAMGTDDEIESQALAFSENNGLDAVIVTAAAKGPEPLQLGVRLARPRSKVVLVGVLPIELDRKMMFEKEVEVMVSKGAGAGSMDPVYETEGFDYPPSLVRWTEARNLEAFLDLVADGKVKVDGLTTHRYPFDKAVDAYEMILGGREPYIGVLFDYPQAARPPVRVVAQPGARAKRADKLGVGIVGVGAFAQLVLLPGLGKLASVSARGLAGHGGAGLKSAADRFGYAYTASGLDDLLADPQIDALFITTRHDSHASMVRKALLAGKHVFVEKPLALSEEELKSVVAAYREAAAKANAAGKPAPVLQVGYNRRFSSVVGKARDFLAKAQSPVIATLRMNVGAVPRDHWVHHPTKGGGRIVGEACHFFDLAQMICGDAGFRRVSGAMMNGPPPADLGDSGAFSIEFLNGSVANVVYTGAGDRAFSRERIEAFSGGRAVGVEEFRTLETALANDRKSESLFEQDMGHQAGFERFIAACRGEKDPLPVELAFGSTLAILRARQAALDGTTLNCELDAFLRGEG